MLNWQKTNLLPIAIPVGETTIHTEARLAFRTDEEGKISLAVHSLRKEPQLDFPYMGHKFSNEEKETLLATGNLGKTIEVTPKNGEPFPAYVSIDPQTNEVIQRSHERPQRTAQIPTNPTHRSAASQARTKSKARSQDVTYNLTNRIHYDNLYHCRKALRGA